MRTVCAPGDGDTVIEPRMHLVPDQFFGGHSNLLWGYIAPGNIAGVKIGGDYHDNYRHGLPSEFGLLNSAPAARLRLLAPPISLQTHET
ncbi:MAG: hypothetical protein GY935_23640 [Gammaproteobacteria bacterium]|nr:hypothetical protein [Gammaproteobacteria bacterium]